VSSCNLFPSPEDHQSDWSELAEGIGALRGRVHELASATDGNRSRGELTIIGSGIEILGFTLGDRELIESADKVLFCVADPSTIVWLKKLRPDALDLYVLYCEKKPRYTTYMQMAEAQLYWVRQGLKVVVIFYGHPGIFVLSTHRAVKIARREGHKAVMKGSVSALDTLCADLGVDPSHPGLQTHEATDALLRQRIPDTTLHVVLWQVGLIGELGYRRQGFLNRHLSYLISWLQRVYGADYEITHYIGSKYPTLPPVIEKYPLSRLHDPQIQKRITGISTFYIPPRDVKPSDPQVLKDLGLLREGERVIEPSSPIREIGTYGPKEMKAFEEFRRFRVPPSYQWQEETGAARFMIDLKFDPALQERYARAPAEILSERRFQYLTDKERAMLASRDPGAVQIACKGTYRRSHETERFVVELLTKKASARSFQRALRESHDGRVVDQVNAWASANGFAIEPKLLAKSIDYIQRNALYPWTGVYLNADQKLLFTLLGNRERQSDGILYVNEAQITRFSWQNGCIQWPGGGSHPVGGFLQPDADINGRRRLVFKVWNAGPEPPRRLSVATEIDPQRQELARRAAALSGEYVVRTKGKPARTDVLEVKDQRLAINGRAVKDPQFENQSLFWRDGEADLVSGEIHFLYEPILDSVELLGTVSVAFDKGDCPCYGSAVSEAVRYAGPNVPEWAQAHLKSIVQRHRATGGLLLWHRWEKQNYTSMAVNRLIWKLS
jgi:hypothetical protein